MSEMSEAWLEDDRTARWRSRAASGPGAGAKASGASLLEVDPGCRLPRHTDSAEEQVVVIAGRAEVRVGDDTTIAEPGDLALVPEGVPHEVRNAGDEVLRFAAVYASAEVTTTYEQPVQPGGGRERDPVA